MKAEEENKRLKVLITQEQKVRKRLELKLREAKRKIRTLTTEKQQLDLSLKDVSRKYERSQRELF